MSSIAIDTAGSRVLRTNREDLSLLVLPAADVTDWVALDLRTVTISLHPGGIQLQSRVVVLHGGKDILGNVGRSELALVWPTARDVPSSVMVTAFGGA